MRRIEARRNKTSAFRLRFSFLNLVANMDWAEPRGSGLARLHHGGYAILPRGVRGRPHPALGYAQMPVCRTFASEGLGHEGNTALLTSTFRDSMRQDPWPHDRRKQERPGL